MISVGRILRTERQSQKRELAQISDELCISPAYLAAIEADDIKNLPGTFFYKSFVAQYSAALGLDYAKLRAGVEAVTSAHEGAVAAATVAPQEQQQVQARRRRPIRVPDPILEAANKLDISGRSLGLSVAGLAVVLLACSSFYTWWNDKSRAVDAATQAEVRQVPVQTAAPASTQITPVSNPVKAEDPSGINVTTSTDDDGVRRVVLNLSATETTWLSITSDGKKVFEGKLSPSESKTLETRAIARIKVGNAGGLDVRWDGKEIGPIGKSGQVKTVLLTPDGAQILSEAVPARTEIQSPAL